MLRRLYDWTMSLAARKTAEVWLAVIAFIESSFFLVPADVLFIPMSIGMKSTSAGNQKERTLDKRDDRQPELGGLPGGEIHRPVIQSAKHLDFLIGRPDLRLAKSDASPSWVTGAKAA